QAFLGVQTRELTPDLKKELGVTVDQGAVVTDVVPNTPAAKVGLKNNDVIVQIDKQTVTGPRDLREAVRKAGTDKEVDLKVMRGKDSKEFKTQLATAPAEFPMMPGFPESLEQLRGKMPPMMESAQKIQELERKVQDLEKRVRELEQKLAKPSK